MDAIEREVNLEESTELGGKSEEGASNEISDNNVAIFDEGGINEGMEPDFDTTDESDFDFDADADDMELDELRRVSGINYGALEEFAGYERYLELKKSGVLTAEEAFYAVNRGGNSKKTAQNVSVFDASKGHMTVSRRKPSSGAVFTRADREELAKWGISATGSELERLWRAADKK